MFFYEKITSMCLHLSISFFAGFFIFAASAKAQTVKETVVSAKEECLIDPGYLEVAKNVVRNNHKIQDVSFQLDYIKKCNTAAAPVFSPKVEDFYRKTGITAEKEYRQKVSESAAKYSKDDPAKCGAVDLRSKLPPIRNQDSLGWCYAFATADFLSFKSGFEVSAIDLATNYATFKMPVSDRDASYSETNANIMGGQPDVLVGYALNFGVCKEKDSPSEYFSENVDTKKYIQNIENKSSALKNKPSSEFIKKCSQDKTLPFDEIKKVLKSTEPQNIVYNLNEQRCKNKKIMLNYPDYLRVYKEVSTKYKKEDLISSIDQKLDLKQPSLVTYDTGFLYQDRQFSPHAVMAVGRRYNPQSKKCEFLIRNSWGESCTPYKGKYAKTSNCDKGHLWVPREELHQNILGVTQYDP